MTDTVDRLDQIKARLSACRPLGFGDPGWLVAEVERLRPYEKHYRDAQKVWEALGAVRIAPEAHDSPRESRGPAVHPDDQQ